MDIKLSDNHQSDPLVSIVIPSFNRKNLLLDAVESCLNQSWHNIEVIIIDDGSTDGTDIMVTGKLASTWPDDQIQYVRQPNRGASAARNLGLKLVRGAYVQFLDSDDLLLPDKIAKQLAVMEKSDNSDAACSYTYGRKGAHSEDATPGALMRIGIRASSPDELVIALCSRVTHGMQTSAPLWRRDFLQAHGGWREDIALGDDLEYHIRLLVSARKICFIDDELFFVREHTGPRLGASHVSASSLASLILARKSIFDSLQERGLWNADTQEAFLGAMRTIYANVLKIGDKDMISSLENWLWVLSSTPRRRIGLQMIFLARRLTGDRFLLGAHAFFSKETST